MYMRPHTGTRTPSTASTASSASSPGPGRPSQAQGLKLSSKRSQPQLYKLKSGSSATSPATASPPIVSSRSSEVSSSSQGSPRPELKVPALRKRAEPQSLPPTVTVRPAAPPRAATTSPDSVKTGELDRLKSRAARSERKVMDLEISNTSLLAVNKFLEKKLHKQSVLLHEYEASSWSAGSNSSHITPFLDSEEEEDTEDESKENKIPLDSLLDENELIDQDGIHAIQDRTNKHIEFVESYERMNRSLRKCLYLSQSLLEDATKSLEYSINPDEVKLGGRVVLNDDDSFDLSSDLNNDSNDETI
ncbi:hypothetical protein TRICI_003958 [Trichomonascus ciferrii]|uniref:Uncharacterized protein n=1 Tax=Trichomonascus ciferrii TaxID=44093 RepID=A0A642V3I6_9ASCO|nr:hypothetical protein TRICI_003958 [Trichomonascus ciferrii]